MSRILSAFTKDELHRFQVTDIPSAVPNSLNNPIHPVYYRDQWDSCPDDVYQVFTPSLRLASMMITCPASLIFYDALIHKYRRRLKEISNRLGEECYEFHGFDLDERDPADPQNLLDVSREITAFRPHLRCRLIQEELEQSGRYAATRRTTVLVKDDDGWTRGTESTISIGLGNARTLREIATKGTVSQLLRVQFHVALTFAHELVHAVNHAVSMETYEPFFEDQRIAELGHAWEQAVFGGRPAFLGPTDACNPLIFGKWPTAFREPRPEFTLERRLPKKTHTFFFIPMNFVVTVQQQEFWQGPTDRRTLKIPKRHGVQIPGEGPFDPTWHSGDSSEGRHRGARHGKVTREDLDDNWEDLEEPPSVLFDWDDFGVALQDENDIKLTRSMIDEFEKDLEEMV